MKYLISILILTLAACSSSPRQALRVCEEGETENCQKPLATNASQAKPNALGNFFHGIGDALSTKEKAAAEAKETMAPATSPSSGGGSDINSKDSN